MSEIESVDTTCEYKYVPATFGEEGRGGNKEISILINDVENTVLLSCSLYRQGNCGYGNEKCKTKKSFEEQMYEVLPRERSEILDASQEELLL